MGESWMSCCCVQPRAAAHIVTKGILLTTPSVLVSRQVQGRGSATTTSFNAHNTLMLGDDGIKDRGSQALSVRGFFSVSVIFPQRLESKRHARESRVFSRYAQMTW